MDGSLVPWVARFINSDLSLSILPVPFFCPTPENLPVFPIGPVGALEVDLRGWGNWL